MTGKIFSFLLILVPLKIGMPVIMLPRNATNNVVYDISFQATACNAINILMY